MEGADSPLHMDLLYDDHGYRRNCKCDIKWYVVEIVED